MGGRTVLLWIAAGVLIGGAYSFHKQEMPKAATIFVGLLAALALVGAILWSL